MRHIATEKFWRAYKTLPNDIQKIADKNFELLKSDLKLPSLHFKKFDGLWSVRVGLTYRALGIDHDKGIAWIWIDGHAEYDRLIS
jgi:hypothetical protein